jgi:transposase
MKKGTQKKIDTPGQQQSVHIFGGYDWQSDQVHAIHHPKRNSEGFCRFLDYLLNEVYARQKVILVMDNARIHTSKMSQAALALYVEQLQVVYLPKYCPFFNPIERFWQHFKTLVNANRLHSNLNDLTVCAEDQINWQNDMQNQLRFTFCKNI